MDLYEEIASCLSAIPGVLDPAKACLLCYERPLPKAEDAST